MLLKDEIRTFLKEKEVSAKEIAETLNCNRKSLYRPLQSLEKDGFLVKSEKIVQGRAISFYSCGKIGAGEVCKWQELKQTFIQNKIYTEKILENDYSDDLRADFRKVRDETQVRHILLIGEVGNGKSIAALELGHLLTPSFSIRDVFFDLTELLDRIEQRPKKITLLMDDAGRMIGNRWWQYQASEKRKLWEYSQICREHRVNLIATAPNMKFIDLHFLRLIGYVFHVCLQCEKEGHAHAVVEKTVPIRTGEGLMPVGVLRLDYPRHLQPLIDDYEKKKLKAIATTTRNIAGELEKAKKLVRTYVEAHIIGRISKTIIDFALYGSHLGEFSVKDIQELIKIGSETLAQERERIRKQEQLQEKIKKEHKKLEDSKSKLYWHYINAGRSHEFARAIAYPKVYLTPDYLKTLEKAMAALEKKVDASVVEKAVLPYLGYGELSPRLKKIEREIFQPPFDKLPRNITNEMFFWSLFDPSKFKEFSAKLIQKLRMGYYRKDGKLNYSEWVEGISTIFDEMEKEEKQKEEEARSEAKARDIIRRLKGLP